MYVVRIDIGTFNEKFYLERVCAQIW
jgi:hypothetical protein